MHGVHQLNEYLNLGSLGPLERLCIRVSWPPDWIWDSFRRMNHPQPRSTHTYPWTKPPILADDLALGTLRTPAPFGQIPTQDFIAHWAFWALVAGLERRWASGNEMATLEWYHLEREDNLPQSLIGSLPMTFKGPQRKR